MPQDRRAFWMAGLALPALLVLGALLAAQVAVRAPREVELAGYATSLAGRTRGQRHNARLATQTLDGVIVPPGAEFSFNRAVGSWSADRGYVKAPVSYEGELVRAFGGGVCQTSTTLYNAALLAGLPVLERHAHVFAPRYVAPGRDAAVAQYDIDLRFRNPFPHPVRVQARVVGERLEIRLLAAARPRGGVEVTTEVLATTAPARLTYIISEPGDLGGRRYLRGPGTTGYRVLTYRTFAEDGRAVRRELLSDDTYLSMTRIVAVRAARVP